VGYAYVQASAQAGGTVYSVMPPSTHTFGSTVLTMALELALFMPSTTRLTSA
jgi:hypothetical protein